MYQQGDDACGSRKIEGFLPKADMDRDGNTLSPIKKNRDAYEFEWVLVNRKS